MKFRDIMVKVFKAATNMPALFGKYQHIGNQPLSNDGAVPFMYTIVSAPACTSIQKTFYLSLAALQRLDVLCLCSLNPAVAAIISG